MPKIASGYAINTNNGVVVVAVTIFFSAVAETGAVAGVGTGMFVAKNRNRKRNRRKRKRTTRNRSGSASRSRNRKKNVSSRKLRAEGDDNSLAKMTGQQIPKIASGSGRRFVGKNDGTTNPENRERKRTTIRWQE